MADRRSVTPVGDLVLRSCRPQTRCRQCRQLFAPAEVTANGLCPSCVDQAALFEVGKHGARDYRGRWTG